MRIESKEESVENLLDGSTLYKIPRFQRPYSWEKDQLEDFWMDVISDDYDDYFIGSMVMFKDKRYLSIIDGQQRLTTIMVFLCAIRNVMRENGLDVLATSLHDNYIEKKDRDGNKNFKLRTETSNPYLQQAIFADDLNKIKQIDASDEHKKLKTAFTYFITKSREYVDVQTEGVTPDTIGEKRKDALTKIRDKILNLLIVYVELDNQEDAFQVFETLNTRGKDLNVADLIKNYLSQLLKSSNKDLDVVSTTWSSINKCFSDSNYNLKLEDFFLYYWLSYQGKRISSKNLFKDFKKTIKTSNASEYLESILNHVELYRFLHEIEFIPSSLKDKNINGLDSLAVRNSLKGIMLFRATMPIPLLLSLFSLYGNQKIKLKTLIEFLKTIEKFHFVYTAVTGQRSKTAVSELYAETAKKIRSINEAHDMQSALNEFRAKLKDHYSLKEEYLYNFKEIIYDKNKSNKKELVRYILQKYMEGKLSTGHHYDVSNYTIEHFSSQDKKLANCHTIGNLLLVNKELNCEKLQNKSPIDKLDILKANDLIWSNDPHLLKIESNEHWGFNEINDRTEEIAMALYDEVLKY